MMNTKIIKYSSYNKPITSYNPQNEVWIPTFQIKLDLKDAENSQWVNKTLGKTPLKLPSLSFEQKGTTAGTEAQYGVKQKWTLLPQLNLHWSGCKQDYFCVLFPSSKLFPYFTIPAEGYTLQWGDLLEKWWWDMIPEC